MGKHSDEQRKRITRSMRTSGKADTPFFRMYEDTFHSDEFQALTPTARLLYIDMGIRSGSNIDDFTFPYRDYRGRYSLGGFNKAKGQLVRAGFIKEKSYYKQESHYALSSEWMRKKPP